MRLRKEVKKLRESFDKLFEDFQILRREYNGSQHWFQSYVRPDINRLGERISALEQQLSKKEK